MKTNLTKEQYANVAAFANRIDKFIETGKDKPYYDAAFKRFYNFTITLAKKDKTIYGAVANTVGKTSDYNGGIIAKCSKKQSFILAIGAVLYGISL